MEYGFPVLIQGRETRQECQHQSAEKKERDILPRRTGKGPTELHVHLVSVAAITNELVTSTDLAGQCAVGGLGGLVTM